MGVLLLKGLLKKIKKYSRNLQSGSGSPHSLKDGAYPFSCCDLYIYLRSKAPTCF